MMNKYGIRKLSRDLQFDIFRLSKKHNLTSEQKSMIKHLFNMSKSSTPARDNIDILTDKITEWRKKYKEDPLARRKETIMQVLYRRLQRECEWLPDMLYWICFELLKSNQKKDKKEPINRVLVLTGNTGVGKTSFVEKLLGSVFESVPIDLKNLNFQNSLVSSNGVQIFVSPDKAMPKEMYDFSLVVNNEHPIDVKGKDPPNNLKFKSGVILSNYSKDKIKRILEECTEDFLWGRFNRRAIWAELGDEMHLRDYLYGNFEGKVEVELEFRQFFFWVEVLRYGTSIDSGAEKKYQQEKIVLSWNDHLKYGGGMSEQMKLFEDTEEADIIETSEVFLSRTKKKNEEEEKGNLNLKTTFKN
jgi:hypothetical protein